MVFIKIIILLTFLHCLISLKLTNSTNKLLFALLTITTLNEILSFILLRHNIKICLNTTLYIIVHDCIWLLILKEFFANKKWINWCLVIFLFCSIGNLLLLQGLEKFNNYTFVFGALLYVCLFIKECILKLQDEDLPFFMLNKFLLATAPLLFFLFFSLLFAFNEKKVIVYNVYGHTMLYTFAGNIANLIYYTIVNLYIFKEKKLMPNA
jgi:hypothetical protein